MQSDGPRPAGAPSTRGVTGSVVVELAGVTKRFGEGGPVAVDDLSLSVLADEILCLLGPSGCGKTTLLRLIAGFERPDAGTVTVAGRVVASDHTWVQPERRRIGFVFQDFALFPHLSVLDNVAFGLSKLPRAERLRVAAEVLDLVGLTVFTARYPHQLSGGQQQRVALARALATEPHLLLLDEPFSNLDAALRGATRDEVRAILKRTGTTAIMVTHDQQEALSFADRVAVMRDGRLEQVGAPVDVYREPRTAFVAGFLGPTNLLRGTARGFVADTALGEVPLASEADGRVVLSLRPESLRFAHADRAGDAGGASDAGGAGKAGGAGDAASAQEPTPARRGRVKVLRREFKGHDVTYDCLLLVDDAGSDASAGELRLLVNAPPDCAAVEGDVVAVAVEGTAVVLRPGG